MCMSFPSLELPTLLRVKLPRVILFRDIIRQIYLIVLISHFVIEKGLQNESIGEIKLLQLVHVSHEFFIFQVVNELIIQNLISICLVLLLQAINDLEHLIKWPFLLCSLLYSLIIFLPKVYLPVRSYAAHLNWVLLYQFFNFTVEDLGCQHLERKVIAALLLISGPCRGSHCSRILCWSQCVTMWEYGLSDLWVICTSQSKLLF